MTQASIPDRGDTTQHTPGPWVFDPTNTGRNANFGYGLMAESGTGWTLAHIPLEVGGESDRDTAEAQAIANARLIAAAPDLLAACVVTKRENDAEAGDDCLFCGKAEYRATNEGEHALDCPTPLIEAAIEKAQAKS